MTESEARSLYVETAKKYLGIVEGSAGHHSIVDQYNSIVPLPVGYKVTYTDDWCATFVSSVAWECGLTDVIFPECSCIRMETLYKNANGWIEKDSYVPTAGDIIMYDWGGTGTGDCDHVGIVTACNGTTITVIEGNYSNSVKYREIPVDYVYTRGFCIPNYAGSSASGDTSNSKKIWDYFSTKLGNEYGVAGLMGNLEAESGLHPDIVQGDVPYSDYSKEYTAKVDNGTISEYDFVHNGPGGGGYGLAQWTYYTRKQGLYDLWKSDNYTSIGSLELAMDYLWQELNASFPGVVSVLKSATSVREASDKVLHDFESPADQSTSVEEKRASMGLAWYNKYAGSTPGGSEEPTPTPRPPWIPSTRKNMPLWLLLASAKRNGA